MQIKYVSTDSPSSKLFCDSEGICNLECLSLDPVYLAIVNEICSVGQKVSRIEDSPTGVELRQSNGGQLRLHTLGTIFRGVRKDSKG